MQGAVAPTVCVDRRVVLWTRGTGASVYADGLRQGIQAAGFALSTLTDSAGTGDVPPGRAWRWLAASSPWPVPARATQGGLLARDVFRRAQVHFDAYGRYLRLRTPFPPALMHWSYPLPLRLAGVPNLYSVLDLIPLLQPDLTPIRQRRSQRMLQRLRHEAAHLVTISETSRQEIIDTLGWPAERVTNTYLPVDIAAVPPDAHDIVAALGLARGDYFLHVGTIERRKNIARLVEAYRQSGSRRPLVLAGPDGWLATEELAAASDLLVPAGAASRASAGHHRIIRIDWLAREAILALIQCATALLAPSLAEGFGLPTVEAMALGTPALTADAGAPAEIASDAALRADVHDVRALAAAITALDTDPALRARLASAGRRRAQIFSPGAYADRLRTLYGAVLAASPPGRPTGHQGDTRAG
jgi:glycosyltransferase involved in cell wall biosynthesis